MARFSTILIANRGEIACRLIRTANALGYRTVAVFSDADADAPHVRAADLALRIGPAAPAQSYLSIPAILAAAKASGADAIHPGYGFLSENPAFAEACAEAGIAFIGPPADAMRAMGGKAPAKALTRVAGVPVVPGYDGDDQSDARLTAEAAAIGFPLMVKASAGGGGRGMRLVHDAADLASALASARAEAKAGFGDDRLLLEKAVPRPRHVEIQVMADTHGNVIHLGERDCSVQRRHQKVIEEAPSPAVTEDIRAAMGAAAVAAAKAVGYVGAGTVEFLLDETGQFFFLEMNTRLQVEHPVTEAITGLDLVALQIAVSEGRPLPLAQKDVHFSGHAIEVRLCAEDAANDFLPATGKLLAFAPAPGVRTDSGVETGSVVSPHYDSLLAKVIAHGATREEVRAKLVAALEQTRALGVVTNRDFLVAALEHPAFAAGEATTAFIGEYGEALTPGEVRESEIVLAAAILAGEGDERPSPIWRETPLKLDAGGAVRMVSVRRERATRVVGGLSAPYRLTIETMGGGQMRYASDGGQSEAAYTRDGDTLWLDAGRIISVRDVTYAPPQKAGEGGDGAVVAPMTGTISRVLVAIGEKVQRGDIVCVIEAMKMEHNVNAGIDGVVEAVSVTAGQQVAARAALAAIRAEDT
jgi:geranyl-CoA carboxylase alpha subunit